MAAVRTQPSIDARPSAGVESYLSKISEVNPGDTKSLIAFKIPILLGFCQHPPKVQGDQFVNPLIPPAKASLVMIKSSQSGNGVRFSSALAMP
jgi:hypothetical protein